MPELDVNRSLLETQLLAAIAVHYPFSATDIVAVFDKTKSYDRTLAVCNYAMLYHISLDDAFLKHPSPSSLWLLGSEVMQMAIRYAPCSNSLGEDNESNP